MYPCTKFQLIWRTSDFGMKFAQKTRVTKDFAKINIKIVIRTYQISVNLENFSFWDQICPKKKL